jgi:XTP/dITP diphosphohydrolase
MKLLLATSNENKAREVEFVLGRSVQSVKVDLPEIQAIDVKDIIENKARAAYQLVGEPVLVEDTGLTFRAWNGLPGALIRWFITTVDNAGLCKMLENYENREATAETCIGYFDGEKLFTFSGTIDGQIVMTPRGNGGFGWDAVFQPNGWAKTFAEMTAEEKDSVSMRKIAVLKLKQFLDDQSL